VTGLVQWDLASYCSSAELWQTSLPRGDIGQRVKVPIDNHSGIESNFSGSIENGWISRARS
jgi:hypothetical protein